MTKMLFLLIWLPLYPFFPELYSQDIGQSPELDTAILTGDWNNVYNLLQEQGNTLDDPIAIYLRRYACILIDGDCSSGVVTLEQNEKQGVASFYQWAIQFKNLYPENTNACFISALGALKMGYIDDAFASIDNSIQLDTNNAAALVFRGFLYALKGSPIQAIDNFTAAIDARPNFPVAYASRAEIYLEMNQFVDAIIDCDRAISQGYKSASIYYVRGKACMEQDNYPSAVIDFSKAVQLDSTHYNSYLERGKIYYALDLKLLTFDNFAAFLRHMPDVSSESVKKLQQIIDSLKVIIGDDEKGYRSIDNYLKEAEAHRNRKNWTQSLAYYCSVIETDSTRFEPYLWRGYILDQLGQPKSALNDLNRAVVMVPDKTLVYKIRAKSFLYRFSKGNDSLVPEYDFDMAVRDLSHALTLRPHDIEAHYLRGLTYDLLYDTASAISDFEYVLENSASADSLWVKKAKQYLQEHK